MSKKEKGVQCFFRFPEELVEDFDSCILRLGYKSRADAFAVFAFNLLEREIENRESLTPEIAADMRGNQTNRKHLTEPQIRKNLRILIGKMLMPVIARRGADIAYEVGVHDIMSEFYGEYGILLTEGEIKRGICHYEMLNKSALREYQLERVNTREETDNDNQTH